MTTAYLVRAGRPVSKDYSTAAATLLTARRQLVASALGLSDTPADEAPFAFEVRVDGPEPRTVEVLAHVGLASEGPQGVHLPVHWRAASGAFSDFDGVIVLERAAQGDAVLSLTGQCVITTAADDASKEATVRTAQSLLEGLAEQLGGGATPDEVILPVEPLLVRDLMVRPPVLLRSDLPLRTAVLLLVHHDVGGAPVVDEQGRLVGILTDSDLLAREVAPYSRPGWESREEERGRRALTVGDACSRPAIPTSPETRLRAAARQLLDHDVSRLVVVAGGEVVGMLTRRSVLHALARSVPELLAAVDAALSTIPGVVADVDAAGQVHLTGVTPRRSDATRAVEVVAALDGVTGVDGDLSWLHDDVPAPSSWYG